MHYFSIFFKRFNKPCVNFFTRLDEIRKLLGNFEKIKFWMKILKKNWIFILFFEYLLLKIEHSEITPFFYNNFFGFGGGDFPPCPGYALGISNTYVCGRSVRILLKPVLGKIVIHFSANSLILAAFSKFIGATDYVPKALSNGEESQ